MIVLLLWLMRRDASLETIAAGAMMGSVAGGMVGLLTMLGYMVRHRRKGREVVTEQLDSEWSSNGGEIGADRHERQGHRSVTTQKKTLSTINPALGKRSRSNGEWIRMLLMYAIPVCLGSLAVPLMNLVDTFTVPRLLRGEGLDELQSMVSFGIYNRGLPLVQLVTMLATSLSVLFYSGDGGSPVKGWARSRPAASRPRAALVLVDRPGGIRGSRGVGGAD